MHSGIMLHNGPQWAGSIAVDQSRLIELICSTMRSLMEMWSMHRGIAAISLKAAGSAGSAENGPLKLFPKANMSNRVLYVLWYPWDVFRLCSYNSRVMWEHGSSWRPDKQWEREARWWESLLWLYFSDVLSFTSFLRCTFETAAWYYNVLYFLQDYSVICTWVKDKMSNFGLCIKLNEQFCCKQESYLKCNKRYYWTTVMRWNCTLSSRYYIWWGRYFATVTKSVLYCMNVCGIEIWM